MRSKPDSLSSSDIDLTDNFSPHEDDSQTLWEVIEIKAEKNNMFKVRWKGTDPKTRKPWPQSWVPKKDCTHDLVLAWRRKQKEKERKKALKKNGRESTASKRTARNSIASTSRTATRRSDSMTTTKSIASTTRGSTAKRDPERGKPESTKGKGRPKQIVAKVHIKEEEEDELITDQEEPESRRPTKSTKGRKRKYSEVRSANSSTNQKSRRGGTIDVEVNDGDSDVDAEGEDDEEEMERIARMENAGGKRRITSHTRPKKKRKIEGQGRNRAKSSTPEDVEIDEEEKMVEDVLSEGLDSPILRKTGSKYDNQDDEAEMEYDLPESAPDIGYYMGNNEENEAEEEIQVEVQGKPKRQIVAVMVPTKDDSDDDDDDEVEILDGPSRVPPPPAPLPSSPSPRPQARPAAAAPVHAKDNTKHMRPPKEDKPSSTEKSQANGHKAKSGSGTKKKKGRISDDLSPPPPLSSPPHEWDREEIGDEQEEEVMMAANTRRTPIFESDPEERAILSPRARSRLKRFDIEVMGKESEDVRRRRREEVVTEADVDVGVGKTTTTTTPAAAAAAAVPVAVAVDPRPTVATTIMGRSLPPPALLPTRIFLTEVEDEVVPETEVENSQSQSQENVPSPFVVSNPPPIMRFTLLETTALRLPITTTTTGAAINGNHPSEKDKDVLSTMAGTKPLRPLPHLSPSTFRPHLEQVEQPFSSSLDLPDSIVEPFSSNEEARRQRGGVVEPIEEFDSPDKSRRGGGVGNRKVVVLGKNSKGLKEKEVMGNGERKQMQMEREKKKKTLEDIVASVKAQRRLVHEDEDGDEAEDQNENGNEEEDGDVADASTRVAPPASGPPAASAPSSRRDSQLEEQARSAETIEMLEEACVDFSGGINMEVDHHDEPPAVRDGDDDQDGDGEEETREEAAATPGGDTMDLDRDVDIEMLKQEEEESTQDLMAEMRALERERRKLDEEPRLDDRRGLRGSPTANGDVVVLTSATKSKVGDEQRKSPEYSKHDVARLSSSSPQRSRSVVPEEEEEHHHQGSVRKGPMTRSRSRSKTPSAVVASRNNNNKRVGRGKKKAVQIPSPVPSQDEFPEPEERPVDVFQNAHESSSSSILAAQIVSLETLLADKQRKDELLQQELVGWQEQVKRLQEEKATFEAEREKTVADLKAQLEAEKYARGAQHVEFAAQVEALTKAKGRAEQDREFIREQYANASAYVTTVRQENLELETRVRTMEEQLRIAENQAKTGVELVKATFELRVKTLETDMRTWRRMAEFVLEKDSRTNDEIRRRAGEEPELREMCGRLRRAVREARGRCEQLEGEVGTLRGENVRLLRELSEVVQKQGRHNDGEEGDGQELVYRCLWRLDGLQACSEVFPTMQGLEQHMYDGGHLLR